MVTSIHRITVKHLLDNITPLPCQWFNVRISSRLLSNSSKPGIPVCSVKSTSILFTKSPMILTNQHSNHNSTLVTSPSTTTVNYHYRLFSTNKTSEQPKQQQPKPSSSQNNQPSNPMFLQPDANLMRYVDELIDFREKPPRNWLTIIKVLVTMFIGVNFGAFMAKLGATLLEKYEIFVRDDDDDD